MNAGTKKRRIVQNRNIYDKKYANSERGKKALARKRYKEYIKRLNKRILRLTSEITALERELTE